MTQMTAIGMSVHRRQEMKAAYPAIMLSIRIGECPILIYHVHACICIIILLQGMSLLCSLTPVAYA